jgi:putative flavoprotein involved in K+ transport
LPEVVSAFRPYASYAWTSHEHEERIMTSTTVRRGLDSHQIEEGTALMKVAAQRTNVAEEIASRREHFDVIVIGGGQAGLAVGYHLARSGIRFVILDASERVGDSWRKRWDSLRLFTSARFDGLDGMPFPAPRNYFPTKDEMADYLERYANHFRLPVRSGMRVERLSKQGNRFVAKCAMTQFEADQIVVAMASYQRPTVPAFAAQLSRGIVQMASTDYRNLQQLRRGGVLIVGAGNSGAELAMEAVRGGHRVWMSGRSTGAIPFGPQQFLGRNLLQPFVLRVIFHRLLTVRTRIGRSVRPQMMSGGQPLIRIKPRDLLAADVQRVPRVVGVREGQPLLADGGTIDVANVIWCSGFRPGFDWIDLPIFGDDGMPRHQGGVVESQPGLYFVGLSFLFAMSSSMIHGVSRDAERIVTAIKARIPEVQEEMSSFTRQASSSSRTELRRGPRMLEPSGTGDR